MEGSAVHHCAAVILLIFPYCCAVAEGGADVKGTADAIAFMKQMIAEQEKAVSLFKKCSFVIDEERSGPYGNVIASQSVMEQKNFNDFRWIKKTARLTRQSGGNRQYEDYTEWFVLNDKYGAWYRQGLVYGCIWEHDSIKEMRNGSKTTLVRYETRNVLNFGFLPESEAVNAMLGPDSGYSRIQLHSYPNKQYQIQFFNPLYSTRPEKIMTVDGQHGYLWTDLSVGDPNVPGMPLVVRATAVPKEAVKGLWVPGVWERYDYEVGSAGELVIYRYSKDTLREFQPVEHFPPEQFTWQTFEFLSGAYIVREDVSGKSEHFDIIDGKLVPRAG